MTLRDEWRLGTRLVGRRVQVFDHLDSTSTRAAQLADDPANDGLAVLADAQTAGRGQYGRSWQSAAGDSVLLSVLLFPPPELRRPPVLTAWAAVSVCEVVRGLTGMQARVKWPNDVLLGGKKVCGILIEQARGTVTGIGLNLNQSAAAFLDAGLTEAGSLRSLAGGAFDPAAVAHQLLERLDEEYARLCEGDLGTLEACWTWRVGLLGREVVAECPDGSHAGRLLEQAFDGLVLEGPDGGLLRLAPETVRQLRPTPSATFG